MLISNGLPYEWAFIILIAIVLIFLVWNFLAIAGVAKFIPKFVRKLLLKVTPLKKLVYWHRSLPKLSRIVIVALLDILLIAGGAYFVSDLFFQPLGVKFATDLEGNYWGYKDSKVEVIFDRAFKPDTILPQMKPEIKGRWEVVKGPIPFLPARKLVFYPEETILPGEKVVIYIANVSNLGTDYGTWDKIIETNSAPIPDIDLVKSAPWQGSNIVSTDTGITLQLTSFDGDFVDWQFTILPEVPFEVIRDKDSGKSTEIRLKFATPLAQSTNYAVKMTRSLQAIDLKTKEVVLSDDPVALPDLVFTTLKAPSLAASEPSGDKVRADAVIKLMFDKPMVPTDVDANLTIEPALEVTKTWVDASNITIQPLVPLQRGTTYKITIPKGTKSADGAVLEQAIVHQFTTLGAVKVQSALPANGSKSVSAGAQIRIEFDQEVDHASAQAKFSLSPSVGGSYSWSGNTMIYTTSGLSYATAYTARVSAGVKSVYGLDGAGDYSFSFTTRPQQVSLNVPLYIQPYRFACNLTAARMALEYRGVNVSVDTLYSRIAKDSTPYNESTNTWGNPNNGFVGDLYGNSKGYGAHWGPVAAVISQYRGASVKSGWNLTDLLKEVEAGNPVIIWAHNGYAGSGVNTTWNLSGGGSVYTVKSMHSYVVRGFVGGPENPSSILVNDPNRGNQTMSVSYFNSLWSTFSRTAIVVK